MFNFKLKSYREFNEWCKSESSGEKQEDFNLAKVIQQHPATHDRLKSLIEALNNRIRDDKVSSITFNADISPGDDLDSSCEYLISGNDEKEKSLVNTINVHHSPNQKCPLAFQNLKIRNSDIRGNGAGIKGVVLENCDIAYLILSNNARLTLKNTRIGTLNIANANLIDMEGGCVLNIETSAPGPVNPLTGSIDFLNTFFPKNRKDYLLPGPQPYRNMRHHLRAIENGQMANLFHSAELAVERERDTGMNKSLSYAYQALSDFGSSAFRPILWWFGIGILSAITIFYTNGTTPTFDTTNKYPGWKTVLVADNCDLTTSAVKAAYLSFSTMLNPLGLMGHRALLVPSTGSIFIMLVLQALLSAILIALMILAIRRRFKMQ